LTSTLWNWRTKSPCQLALTAGTCSDTQQQQQQQQDGTFVVGQSGVCTSLDVALPGACSGFRTSYLHL
jgi:hypothetical protein